MPIPIPLSLADVDADWMTQVLRESGVLGDGKVLRMETRVVGEGAGFMGEVVKLGLTLSPDAGTTPRSLVLKIPTTMDNRHVGQTLGVYEREIRFYRELQPRLNIRTPRHIYSAMDADTDPEQTIKALKMLDRMPMWLMRASLPFMNWLNSRTTYRFALLIENLEDYRIGDQVGGCTREEAEVALGTMARMHARFWGGRDLEDFRWLLSLDLAVRPVQMLYLQAVDQFKEAHQGWLTPHAMATLDWLKAHYYELMARFGELPDTLIHGDFRLDNLCFDDARGEIILFDWQTLGRGPSGFDLAYFLSASFAEEGAPIDALLDYYRERLAGAGVAISPARLRWQYEAGLLAVVHRVVPAQFQDMLSLGDGRGMDLIDTWLARAFRELEHIDPDRILLTLPA